MVEEGVSSKIVCPGKRQNSDSQIVWVDELTTCVCVNQQPGQQGNWEYTRYVITVDCDSWHNIYLLGIYLHWLFLCEYGFSIDSHSISIVLLLQIKVVQTQIVIY